jgi:glycosyltransferase involved in cell wall biosynthesis
VKVLFCQPSSAKNAISGPERQTVAVGRVLRERGHHVTVGVILVAKGESAQNTTLGAYALQAGLAVEALYLPQRYHLGASVRTFRRFLAQVQPDVVCTAGYKADIVAALAGDVPSVAWTPGWTGHDLKVRLFEWLDKRLLWRHGAVVTVSRTQSTEVERFGVLRDRVFCIPTAVDLNGFPEPYNADRLRAEIRASSAQTLIGVIGRLSLEKGQRYAIEAMNELDTYIHLLVVGEGRERETLRLLICERRLNDRVHLLGERGDARSIIGGLDLMVLPSLTEGIPNVILEAFAYKTPVVATAVGGVPELVIDGETGWLVPPRDPHALAQAIREALSNPAEARRRADNAYRHLLTHFTVEKQAEAWEKALQTAVENWQKRKGEHRFLSL